MKKNAITTELKDFFKTAINRYGEEMAYAMTTWDKGVLESINYYSKNRFEQYDKIDLYKELARNEVLCDDSKNNFVRLTKNLAAKGDMSTFCEMVDLKKPYKEALIKAYIKYAHVSIEYRIQNCQDEEKFTYLQNIDKYRTKKTKAKAKQITKEKKD